VGFLRKIGRWGATRLQGSKGKEKYDSWMKKNPTARKLLDAGDYAALLLIPGAPAALASAGGKIAAGAKAVGGAVVKGAPKVVGSVVNAAKNATKTDGKFDLGKGIELGMGVYGGVQQAKATKAAAADASRLRNQAIGGNDQMLRIADSLIQRGNRGNSATMDLDALKKKIKPAVTPPGY
jgi:hypothetical protein